MAQREYLGPTQGRDEPASHETATLDMAARFRRLIGLWEESRAGSKAVEAAVVGPSRSAGTAGPCCAEKASHGP
jgi:hypothetical protein